MINVIMHRSQLGLKREKQLSCYAGQFHKYEGLACNFAAAIDSAGDEIVGRQPPLAYVRALPISSTIST
jgi:hypothetical protein